MIVNREIVMKRRPDGLPQDDDFELVERPLAEPTAGQVLTRSLFFSVDPYQRNRMRAGLKPGDSIPARSVAEVISSRDDKLKPGDRVFDAGGTWREYSLTDGSNLQPLHPDLKPPQIYLGVAGVPGLTAYVGLLDHGQPKTGETVFVSAAAGAVGSLACQIARIKGCRVVGSAGSDEKVEWLLKEARIDAAFNYKKADNLAAEVRRHCPDGIDVLFENVAGPQLDAAMENMRPFGRMVLCGMMATINADARPGLANIDAFMAKRLRLQGFSIGDHMDRMPAFRADLKEWLKRGEVKWRETIIDGLENAPTAFIRLIKGEIEGKALVRLSDPRKG